MADGNVKITEGDELTDEAFARILAHVRKRNFILVIPEAQSNNKRSREPYLQPKRRY